MHTFPTTARRLLLAATCMVVVGAFAGCAETPTTPKHPLQKRASDTCVLVDGQLVCTG